MKLYELPQRQNIKLYGLEPNGDKDGVVIFDHIDGMYSYCWIEGQEDAIVHLNASTEFVEHKDGYRLKPVPILKQMTDEEYAMMQRNNSRM